MTTIKLKNGSGAPLAGDLVQGEPALDLTNKRLYTEDSGGTVIEVGTNPTSVTTSGLTVDGTGSVTQNSNSATALVSFTNSNAGASSRSSVAFTSDTASSVFGTVSSGWTVDALSANETFMYGTNGVALFAPASQNVRILAGGSERMRIDSSGNVGIGTSSIDFQASNRTVVHVEGSAGALLALEDTGAKSYLFQTGDDLLIENDTASGSLVFGTNASTERMRIDANGNVGIGTTTNISGIPLEIKKGGAYLGLNSTTDGFSLVRGYDNGTERWAIGQAGFGGADGVGFYTGTSVTERMRIDSSGNLLIGTTTTFPGVNGLGGNINGTMSEVGGSFFLSRVDSNTVLYINRGGTDGVSVAFSKNAGTAVGTISVTSSSTSYNTSSDYRLKENVVPLTGAIDRVKQLKPSRFNFIADADTTVDGFLAHEVADVVPEAITGTKDAMRDEEYEVTPAVYEDVVIPAVLDEEGNEVEAERTEQQLVSEAVMGTRSVPDYQGIDQSKLVPLLVATIQELEARITALESN